MARVGTKRGPLVRIANWYTRRKYGREIGSTGAIAHTPWNMIGWGTLEFGYERSHKVDERLKALAATRAATVVGCQFCIDIGSAIGREAGVTEQQLRDFHVYRESPAFSPLERLVMEYAEQMSQAEVRVPDETFAALREHFDDAQIVELTAAIAIENFRARFNNALDIPPAGFSEGAFCPLPDTLARSGDQPVEAAPA
jgi:AhpD family alkylhydroperoxidase